MAKATLDQQEERLERLYHALPACEVGGQGWGRSEYKAWGEKLDPAVTYKTVSRDLALLESRGWVMSQKGKAHRWFKKPGLRISGPMSMAEALCFTLLGERLHNLLPASLQQELAGQFAKAKETMAKPDASQKKKWLQKVQVAPRLLSTPAIPEFLPKLVDAVIEQYEVEIDYKNRQQTNSRKNYLPLGLVQQDEVIYLICQVCEEGTSEIRHLRVDRIIEFSASEKKPFQYPKEFDLEHYLAGGALDYRKEIDGRPADPYLDLHLRLDEYTARHLDEQTLPQSHIHWDEVKDGKVELHAKQVPNTRRLRWWLQSLGLHVEVLEPASLRNEMADVFTALAARYKR